MLKMHFQLALRNLRKNKIYSIINIAGLAVGVAACLLIFRLIHYELSFDNFHRDYKRLGRIVTQTVTTLQNELNPGAPLPAMDVIRASIPQVEQSARVHIFGPQITAPEEGGASQKFYLEDGQHAVFTEPSFFHLFDWQWLGGDAQTALESPAAAVLAESVAKKCFGSVQQALGQRLLLDREVPVTVRGVVADAPLHSDFQIQLFVSYKTLEQNPKIYNYKPEWGSISSNDHFYVRLAPGVQPEALTSLLSEVGKEERKSTYSVRHFIFQPLSELHYNAKLGHMGSHQVSKSRLWTLGIIGLMILLMACINFINLATAQAASRSKEVGVRKSLGSSQGQLLRQFMGETTFIVLIAVALGIGLASGLSPFLKQVSDAPPALRFLSDPAVWIFAAAVAALVSLGAGFYPALVLSGFGPVQALKNKITTRSVGGASLRNSLVLVQFVVAQALIIGTLIATAQMDHLRRLDLGYQSSLVYNMNMNPDSLNQTKFEVFKAQLLQLPAVEAVSLCNDAPSSDNNWGCNFALGRGSSDAPFNVFLKYADADYFKTYNLRLLAGRSLQPSDTMREVVLNETVLKKMGISDPQEVLGKEFRLGAGYWLPVVGVVQDFKVNSAREEIRPVVMMSKAEYYYNASVKIRPENLAGTLASLRQCWESNFPREVFDADFLDDQIARFYEQENRFAALCKGFTLLAIFISCLGLYGLASLLAVQKTKEIGIRKVLGASVASVLGLLSKDFLLLVLLAFFVAAPLAWWGMTRWLQDFVYRIDIDWAVFAFSGLLALAIALLTVSFQALKAALRNPSNSLRSE